MRQQRAFSLIEMLLVLFVIVMLTSLVSLNLDRGSARENRQQLQQLREAARYAMDEARFSGRDFGLLLMRRDDGSEGLRLTFRERLAQGWRPPERPVEALDDLLFDGDTELTLLLDGVAVAVLDPLASGPGDGRRPQWVFFASGETQAGELLWRQRGDGALLGRLQWDALGRFEAAADDGEGRALAEL